MKVAIPVWNERVSPVFDTAGRILIVDFEDGKIGQRVERRLAEVFPPLRVRCLCELGVDVLICGAVSNPLAAMIDAAGIRLLPWISGDIDEVLEAFGSKGLEDNRYCMPGYGCRWRGGMRGGRGGGRHQRGRRRYRSVAGWYEKNGREGGGK